MAAKARTVLLSLAALCLPAFANVPRTPRVAEKPHQGVEGFVLASHRGPATANALIAPGIARCLCDEGRRSRSTGKERDVETGLDYFLARYYSGAHGRFLSPDEWQGGPVDAFSHTQSQPPGPLPYADVRDPQSLNKYTYVLNNPLRYTDPDGHLALVDDGLELLVGAVVVTAAYYSLPPEQRDLGRAITSAAATISGWFQYNKYEKDSKVTESQALIGGATPVQGGDDRDKKNDDGKKDDKGDKADKKDKRPDPREAQKDKADGHKTGGRESTRRKHERGDSRRGRDRGGEKADERRPLLRTRPENWKGPWPPKGESTF